MYYTVPDFMKAKYGGDFAEFVSEWWRTEGIAQYEDPEAAKDLREKLIYNASQPQGRVLIYCDYDVDGMFSAKQFHLWLTQLCLNHRVDYVVASRSDGYGYTYKPEHDQYTMVLILDTGTNSPDVSVLARAIGPSNIYILDHHKIDTRPPDGVNLLHPRAGTYPSAYSGLCTAGLAYQALWRGMDDLVLGRALWYAGVGTLADMVPLYSTEYPTSAIYNQSLVRMMQFMTVTPGYLTPLIPSDYETTWLAWTWKIAPAINAMGRLGHEQECLKILLDEDIHGAARIMQVNDIRKKRQNKYWSKIDTTKPTAIFYGDDAANSAGLSGIIAGRISNNNKTAAMVAFQSSPDKVTGSFRSCKADVHKFIHTHRHLGIEGGGHEHAAGFSAPIDKINDICAAFEDYIKNQEIEVDFNITITSADVSHKTFNQLKTYSPYGTNYAEPNFYLPKLELRRIIYNNDSFYILQFADEHGTVSALGNNIQFGQKIPMIVGKKYDIVGYMRKNSKYGLQIEFQHIRESI